MPMITTHIYAVTETKVRTSQGWKPKFYVDPGHRQNAYETWSAWHASLCDQARKTGQRVTLGLRDQRGWAQEIVSAELEGMETQQ